MKKRIYIVFSIVIILSFFVIFLFSFYKFRANKGEIPISRMQGSFAIDVHDQRELIGSADYVFVGTVLQEDGYEYRYPVTKEMEGGGETTITSPFSKYTVQVIENIKGNLTRDTGIPIMKEGGLLEDGSCYELYEDDELPRQNETYIFYAYAQMDGSLMVAGPNSNIRIEKDHDPDQVEGQNMDQIDIFSTDGVNDPMILSDTYQDTLIYQEVIEAADHPADIDRERSISIYEADQTF